jgi:dephospho-CoA kinase
VRAARSQVQAQFREPRLLPDEEKVKLADYVYVNDGSLDELDAFVAGVMDDLNPRE